MLDTISADDVRSPVALEAAADEHLAALLDGSLGELFEHPRLADAGFAHDGDQTTAPRRLGEPVGQAAELDVPTDHG
jgi:hypothetical protein